MSGLLRKSAKSADIQLVLAGSVQQKGGNDMQMLEFCPNPPSECFSSVYDQTLTSESKKTHRMWFLKMETHMFACLNKHILNFKVKIKFL